MAPTGHLLRWQENPDHDPNWPSSTTTPSPSRPARRSRAWPARRCRGPRQCRCTGCRHSPRSAISWSRSRAMAALDRPPPDRRTTGSFQSQTMTRTGRRRRPHLHHQDQRRSRAWPARRCRGPRQCRCTGCRHSPRSAISWSRSRAMATQSPAPAPARQNPDHDELAVVDDHTFTIKTSEKVSNLAGPSVQGSSAVPVHWVSP